MVINRGFAKAVKYYEKDNIVRINNNDAYGRARICRISL